MIYSLCTCEDCGAHFAAHCRAWARIVRLSRVRDLEHAVAELPAHAPLICADCAGRLAVTVPCAVRTQAGAWLALDLGQREWSHAN